MGVITMSWFEGDQEFELDDWKRVCFVAERCPRCDAPKLTRKTDSGVYSQQFHDKSCGGTITGAWHRDARSAMEQSRHNDGTQMDWRKKEYGANIEAPPGYTGPKRAPNKPGFEGK